MNPWVVHFYFPIFGTLFIPIDMECPNCGTQFKSDFKLGRQASPRPKNVFSQIFELPSTLLRYLGRWIGM